jgi:dipeptidyl aminopeptidase/acylaminoacyl peptidase
MQNPAIAAAPNASATPSQLPRVITHADLWLMPRVSAPVLSPDAQHVVFSLIEPAYTPAQQMQDLWLVATNGKSPARRLTRSMAPESGVNWAPDSQMLAFSTQREGDLVPQIYTLSLRGGDAMRATALTHGARAPKFLPDGKQLLFIANVFAGAGTEEAQKAMLEARATNKSSARVYTGFPIRFWDKWLDDKQIRPFLLNLEDGTVRDLLVDNAITKQPGYGGQFAESTEELDTTISPNGKIVLAISSNRNRAAFSFTHTDLYAYDPATSALTRLTGKNSLEAADSFSKPVFSKDGRSLFALRSARTAKVYNASELVAFEVRDDGGPGQMRHGQMRPGEMRLGEMRVLAMPQRLAISSFAVGATQLSLTVEENGSEQLWQCSFKLDRVKRLNLAMAGHSKQNSQMTHGVLSALSGNDRGLVGTYENAQNPMQIVRIDVGGSPKIVPLTGFGQDQLKQIELSPAEHFFSARSDGSKIHSMLIRPARFDATKKYPLLVLIHGGPHIMWRDAFFLRWNYHLLAQDKYVVLLSNYRGSTGSGEAFAQAIQGDPFKGPNADLELAADDAVSRFSFIDAKRQCAAGASYGGHLVNWIQGINTTRFRCLISHAGLVNAESQWGTSDLIYGREVNAGGPVWEQGAVWREQNPIRLASAFKTPILVSIGELDYRVPLNNTLEYWSALQRMQVPSKLMVFPDENHWILKGDNSKFFYDELASWLEKYLSQESQ